MGLKTLQANVQRYGSKGLKLYTAEWNNGSRGYKLSDPACYRYLEAAQNLGIKNVHVHKGPTIWPLDKDAFDAAENVDHAATDFPDLNFIVEHVGLPRTASTASSSVTEHSIAIARRPPARMSSAQSSAIWRFTSTHATSAPASPSAMAIPAPMFGLVPVTTATVPSSAPVKPGADSRSERAARGRR